MSNIYSDIPWWLMPPAIWPPPDPPKLLASSSEERPSKRQKSTQSGASSAASVFPQVAHASTHASSRAFCDASLRDVIVPSLMGSNEKRVVEFLFDRGDLFDTTGKRNRQLSALVIVTRHHRTSDSRPIVDIALRLSERFSTGKLHKIAYAILGIVSMATKETLAFFPDERAVVEVRGKDLEAGKELVECAVLGHAAK